MGVFAVTVDQRAKAAKAAKFRIELPGIDKLQYDKLIYEVLKDLRC